MEKTIWKKEKNLSLMMDFYELTMTNSYFLNEKESKQVYFDYFFRRVPDGGAFAVTAGLETFIKELMDFSFSDEDIKYLEDMNIFNKGFLRYLKNFKFTGDIYAIPEGTPVFPNTPVVTIKTSILEANLIETILLNIINHQSLIATKASRIVRAAKGKAVVDMGPRRAHGADASLYGARASYIAGFAGTSLTLAGRMFDIPLFGTMAHSYVQIYGDDSIAFSKYQNTYPSDTTFLVDTFGVVNSGVPAAIEIFKKMPKDSKKAIRLDSGDLSYLSKKSREMLDQEGFEDVKIIASSSLDEDKITEIEYDENSRIDFYGVGERNITARSEPVFGGVYKLAAVEENGEFVPRIKMSETRAKITNPGVKTLYRLYEKDTGKAFADYLTLNDEIVPDEIVLFNEEMPWIKKTVRNFTTKKLQETIIKDGEIVYDFPTLEEIREYHQNELDTLWGTLLKLKTPDSYFVNLSFNLWTLKQKLLTEHGGGMCWAPTK